MVSFPYTIVEFIVDNRAPVARLLIFHWLHISSSHVLWHQAAARFHGLALLADLLIRRHVGWGWGVSWELEWTGRPRAGRRVWISTTAGWRRRIWRVGRNGKRTPSTPSATATATATSTPTVWLLEGFWKGGVQGHVWFVVGEIAELYQQAVLWVELTVPWYQDRREHRTLHSLVVIWVDADLLLFGAKRIFAHLQGLELVVRLEVGPAPHSTVDDMRQTFPVGNL